MAVILTERAKGSAPFTPNIIASRRKSFSLETGPQSRRGQRNRVTVSEAHLLEYVRECVREAQEERLLEEQKWSAMWDLYNGIQDMSGKEGWQSQLVVPRPFVATEQGAALIERALVDHPDYFQILPSDAADDPLIDLKARFWTSNIRWWFRPNRVNFPRKFGTMSLTSLIQGVSYWGKIRFVIEERRALQNRVMLETFGDEMEGESPDVALRLFADVSPQLSGQLAMDVIPTERVFVDTKGYAAGRPLYLVHREYADFHLLDALSDAGVYDRKALKAAAGAGQDIRDDEQSHEAEQRRREQNTLKDQARHKFRREVRVEEFWGDILDEHGKLIAQDQWFAIANDQRVILKPTPNPLWSKKIPFVAFDAIPHPNKPLYGKGILESAAGIARAMNNALNMQMDSYQANLMAGVAVKPEMLANPEDIDLHPLKVWLLKPHAREDAVRVLSGTTTHLLETLQLLTHLSMLWQNSSFVSDIISGGASSIREMTATEVQQKMSQASAIFARLVSHQENEGGARIVELAYDHLLQYQTDNLFHPTLKDLFGAQYPRLRSMDDEERMAWMHGELHFDFYGPSAAIKQNQYLASILRLLEILGPAAGNIGVNMRYLVEEAVKSLRLDPAKVLTEPGASGNTASAPAPAPPGPGPLSPENAQGRGGNATMPFPGVEGNVTGAPVVGAGF